MDLVQTFLIFAAVMIIDIAFVTTLFLLLSAAATQFAYGACIRDEDWPDKPCLDLPPYSDGYMKQIWQQYYEYKGKDLMEMKKAEMYQTISNGTLREWVETSSSPNNFANYNVWYYYYLNGEAPNAYGPQPTQEQLQECKELGITLEECSDTAITQELALQRGGQIPVSDEEIRRIEDQQNQINNSMYMMGIGVAIAGIIAFVTLRKRKLPKAQK